MASSSSRTRSRSPFSHRRPPSTYSSASSTSSSYIHNRLLPRSSSTPTSTVYNSSCVSAGPRSMTISRTISDSGPVGGSGNYGAPSPVPYPSEGLIGEPMQSITSERDSISVTVRFRPMSEREYQRGDEIAWYPEADKMVRNEYNPLIAYAFDKVFGPQATTIEVYDVASKPVVKAAMEGVNVLKSDLLQDPSFEFTDESRLWVERMLDYNVCGGKLNRGLSVVDSFKL